MQIQASTPEEYLKKIPEEKREPFEKVRRTILDNIPEGFEEITSYGMIGYVVPHSLFPAGYHVNPDQPLPFAGLAAQKNFIGFYHMGLYADKDLYDWFVDEYAKQTKYKLDMGKSCVRLKRPDDIPHSLIGELMRKLTPEEWISRYESGLKKKK